MSLRSVFLGHWRALEKKWLGEFLRLSAQGTVAVITAGNQQSDRLKSLLDNSVSGARFYPGIPKLAEALSESITSAPPSTAQSIVLACHAGYDSNAAPSSAEFFERLIDSGIDPEIFHTQVYSLKSPDQEVLRTAEMFKKYGSQRTAEHGYTLDSEMSRGPCRTDRFQTYMFYGFYDLNPGQRSYIKALQENSDVFWFSPVHPSHYWRSAFTRTLDFLKGMYSKDDFHRVDGAFPLSPLAQFGENLLTEKAMQSPGGIQLKRCGYGSSFTRAVCREIEILTGPEYNFQTGEIAVSATGRDAQNIVSALKCADIPCYPRLTVSASELPWGRLILRLLSLPDNQFHHSDIERLLATGAVRAAKTPDPFQYASYAESKGARYGLNALAETEYTFALEICRFFRELPDSAPAEIFLDRLSASVKSLSSGSVPAYWFESVLNRRNFISKTAIDFTIFRKLISKALEERVNVSEKTPGGIQILSPERIRGTVFKAVIITGMEEGNFPRKSVSDPRLPVKLKQLLQMPSPDNRETEEAFLLRQVFEAAEKQIAVIARNTDTKGRTVSLSPFLLPLQQKHRPGIPEWKVIPVRPSADLCMPENPPFLTSSLTAQRERLFFNADSPAPSAIHSGMVGSDFFDSNRINASMLETWARREFDYLTGNLWKIREIESFPVRSTPAQPLYGVIVHSCVEDALENPGTAAAVVENQCRQSNMPALLGSVPLAEIWKKHTIQGIEALEEKITERNWTLVEKEKALTGTVAGYSASGRIDLIFKDCRGRFILADLKTGKPKDPGDDKLFQLPFYAELAGQNGYSPIAGVCYIHLQSSGTLTFKEMSSQVLAESRNTFETQVREIMDHIKNGVFPYRKPEKRYGR